jgi:hypothetical protein
MMFRNVPTRPFFDLPVSSCIRVFTYAASNQFKLEEEPANVRRLYKSVIQTTQQRG